MRELQRFFEEHDKQKYYAGLCRICDIDGTAVWTALADPSAVKAAIESRAACATVDRTDLRLALRSVWSLGTRGDPSVATGQQRRVLAALDRMAQIRDGGAYGEAVRTARRTIDGLGQGRELPSDTAWLTTLSVIGGMVPEPSSRAVRREAEGVAERRGAT